MSNASPHTAVTIALVFHLIRKCWAAGRVPFLYGSPGIGKSAIAAQLADERGLPLVVLIGSTLDGSDLGIPVVQADGSVCRRAGDAGLQRAVHEPVVLLIDEISTAPADVKAALLDIVLSRRLPSGEFLHPLTVILSAGNPPDECPAGDVLEAALINRFAAYHLQPTVSDVQAYFRRLAANDAEKPGVRYWADAFATLLDVDGRLVTLSPPQASIADGAQWASPRAWESGVRILAELTEGDELATIAADTGIPERSITSTTLAGVVGADSATAFLALLDLRERFPTPDAVVADPTGADVPEGLGTQVGILGLLDALAERDAYAGVVYAHRCEPEIGRIAIRRLVSLASRSQTKRSAHKRAAVKIAAEITAATNRARAARKA